MELTSPSVSVVLVVGEEGGAIWKETFSDVLPQELQCDATMVQIAHVC